MKKGKWIIFFIFLTLSQLAWAYLPEPGNVTATLGSTVYKTDFRNSITGATSPFLGGVGLLAVGDIDTHGSLEIGLFDMHKIYFRQQEGQFIAEEKEVVHITMGYRRWLNSYLSTSLTFYSSYSLGAPTIVHSDFPPGTEIDTSARDTTEYGFDIALQSEVWNQEKFAVIADVRYSLSVTNKSHENSNHYGLFLGLRYLIQEK